MSKRARRIKAKFEFEPRDLWIGVYWDKHRLGSMYSLDLYICLVPTLPLHIVYRSFDPSVFARFRQSKMLFRPSGRM